MRTGTVPSSLRKKLGMLGPKYSFVLEVMA